MLTRCLFVKTQCTITKTCELVPFNEVGDFTHKFLVITKWYQNTGLWNTAEFESYERVLQRKKAWHYVTWHTDFRFLTDNFSAKQKNFAIAWKPVINNFENSFNNKKLATIWLENAAITFAASFVFPAMKYRSPIQKSKMFLYMRYMVQGYLQTISFCRQHHRHILGCTKHASTLYVLSLFYIWIVQEIMAQLLSCQRYCCWTKQQLQLLGENHTLQDLFRHTICCCN